MVAVPASWNGRFINNAAEFLGVTCGKRVGPGVDGTVPASSYVGHRVIRTRQGPIAALRSTWVAPLYAVVAADRNLVLRVVLSSTVPGAR